MKKSKTFVLFSLLMFLFTFPLFSEDSENAEETIVFIESAKKTEYKKIEEDDVVIFSGNVRLSVSKTSQEIYIEADYVVFNRNRSTLYAEGNVVFTELGKGKDESKETLTASSLLFNTETMEGVFDSARVVQESSKNINLSNGTTLIVSSELFGKENSGTVTFKNGTLTFCDDENPHWKIKASRIWLLPGNEFSFFNALLYVGNIPVFYLPFFYYPKDEMIFNPVFGYRPREGYFVQTTTYLVGRKPLQENSSDGEEAGLLDFMKNTELMEQKREGLFLTNTEEKATMPKNSLKIMADIYSNLGGMAGIDGNFIDIGPISSLSFGTYFGFSNTLFPTLNNQYSKYSPSGKTYYDNSYFLGLKLPFRFYGNFAMKMSFSPFTLNVNIPIHSDQWFKNDFLNRSETMDWITFLLEDSNNNSDFSTSSEINSYSWNISGSMSTPSFIKNLSPYIESFSINTLSSSLNFATKTNEILNGETESYSPERKFFYPASVYPLKIDSTISGSLVSLSNKITSSKKQRDYDFSEDDFIIPSDIDKNFESEKSTNEELVENQNESQNNEKSKNSNESFISEDFLPEIKTSTISSQNTTNYEYKLSYTIKPNFASEINYFSEEYTSPKDINLSKIETSYISVKSPVTLASNLTLKNNFLSINNSFDFTPSFQSHPIINEEYENSNEAAINKIKLADFNASKIELKNTNAFVFRPFVFVDNISNFNISWNTSLTLLRSKFLGDIHNPKWEYLTIDWSSETISKNSLSVTFSTSQLDGLISESITLTGNLPPLTSSYSGTVKFKFPFCTNMSFSMGYKQKSKDDTTWIFEPFNQNSSWNFFNNKITLTQSFKYDLENMHPEKLSFTVKMWGLTSSYTMNYTNPYKFSTEEGTWNLVNEKEFLPYDFKISYTMPKSNLEFFAGDFTISPTFNSEIRFDLIQFTGCYLSVSPGISLKITDSLTFTFSALSRNDVIYRYVQDWFDLGVELPGETNFFKDLFNSFAFWNTNLRQASGFKLKKLSMTLSHDLHDWTLNSSFSLEPRLIKTSKPYRYDFSPYFTLSVAWKPMSSLKTTIEDKYGEFLLY